MDLDIHSGMLLLGLPILVKIFYDSPETGRENFLILTKISEVLRERSA